MKRTTGYLLTIIVSTGAAGAVARAQTVELTLQKAISMAEAYAPQIKQAEAGLSAQKAKVAGAYTNLGPKLNGEYNHAVFEQEKTVNFGGSEIVLSPKESRTASLTLVQPLSGLVSLSAVAAFEGRNRDLQQQKVELTKAQIRFQTAELYLLANSAHTMLSVAEGARNAAQKQVGDAQSLFAAGRIHKGDLLKLELAASNATAEVARAKAAKIRITSALLGMIGLPLGSDVRFAAKPAAAKEPAELALQQVVDGRKDVRAAGIGVQIADYGKDLARSEFFPSINAFGKIDFNLGEPAGLGGGSKKNQYYGLQATWQLWNNGTHVLKVREAAHQTRAAEESLRATIDQARIEVVSAQADLAAAREAMVLAKTALEQAREAQRIEQVKFKAGGSSATELVLAESARTFAEGNVVAASADFQIRILKLQKAYGMEQPVFQEGQ
jgi:outer membrane protein TolC